MGVSWRALWWDCRGEVIIKNQWYLASSDIWGFYAFRSSADDSMIGVVVIGFFSGIISGMGIGGGTLLIPALILILGMEQHAAQGVNLIYFLPTAVTALVTHQKNHNVLWKTAKPLALFGVVGAVAGSLLAVSLEADVLRKVFAGFLFLMGLSELFKKNKKSEDG